MPKPLADLGRFLSSEIDFAAKYYNDPESYINHCKRVRGIVLEVSPELNEIVFAEEWLNSLSGALISRFVFDIEQETAGNTGPSSNLLNSNIEHARICIAGRVALRIKYGKRA